jgi:cobalt/nickel transport system ATP-binding protein
MTNAPRAVFSLSRVSYNYDGVPALNQISLDIPAGKHLVLLGPNGSGKSTLLRLLDALACPHSGAISFRGQTLTETKFADTGFAFDFRRRVGLVFQNPEVQLFNPTVFDEVAFGPLQLRWPKPEILSRVNLVLDRMEIRHLRDRAPHRLSGGEKKRVALASVLVLDPEVLLLDEPTASLDPRSETMILELLTSLGPDRTVVTATHDLGLARDLADYCCLLSEGKLVVAGEPAAILTDSRLLDHVNLIHADRHRHASGLIHSHPHQDQHRHDHL